MYKFLFRSRFGALAFVGFTLVSITTLVGTDGEGGLIQYGVNSFTNQQDAIGEEIGRLDAQRDRPVRRVGTPQPTYTSEIREELEDDEYGDEGYEEGSWSNEDDLISSAEGIDPTPIVSTEFNPEEGEIVETFIGGRRRPKVPGDE